MTLERHRSKMMPDIDFGGDGRLLVTDREGTFPLRLKASKKVKENQHKKDDEAAQGHVHRKDTQETEERQKTWEDHPDYHVFDDLSSYRSFDPQRDAKRKYKPKQISNYERAVREVTGTLTSHGSSSSLNRKLRRSRSHRARSEPEGRFGAAHSVDMYDSIRRFKRGQKPTMPPEMRASLRRENKRYRSLDVNALRKTKRKEANSNGFLTDFEGKQNGVISNGHIPESKHPDFPFLERRLSHETLPRWIFIVTGILLILCGIVRLLLSRWHEYFHPLWCGSALLLLGLLAIYHRAEYLHRSKNALYILVAALCSVTTMVSTALILQVLVPLTEELALDDLNNTDIVDEIDFSRWSDTLVYKSMSLGTMIYLSLILDYVTLVLNLAGFFSLTAMLICIDNFIDASYHVTGECDHLGTPKYFNPLSQTSLAQATLFIGIVVMVIQTPSSDHFYSPSWAPFCMLIAAFLSIFYGKRPDLKVLGFISTVLLLLGMLACGAATVLMTLAFVEGITEITDDDSKYREAELIVSACAHALFILLLIINIVFSVGVAFRHFRILCCGECFGDYSDDVYDHYAKKDKHYDIRF